MRGTISKECDAGQDRIKVWNIRYLLIALGALTAVLVIVGSASAKTVELTKYNGAYPAASFDGTGSVGGTAPFPSGLHDMGFNQEAGQVFVGDSGSGRIYKFSAAGIAEAFSGLGANTVIPQTLNNFGDVIVDNSATATKGRIYGFPESGPVAAYQPSGQPAPNFPVSVSGACGGDVAPDGSVWIVSYNQSKAIQINAATGVATGASFSTPSPCDLAIDTLGNFYAVQESGGTVRKYDSAGVLQGIFDDTPGGGEPELAIDRSNNHVFVDRRSFILEYDSSGTLLTRFGEAEGGYPGLQSSRGIAVRASNHMVYAMNERNGTPRVDTFVPTGPITIPDVTANPADNVHASTVTLHGAVNGDGIDTTDCHFEYGTNTSYGSTAPCEVAGVPTNVFAGGSGDHEVTADLSGLVKGTTYHFRLTAKNANDVVSTSNDMSVTPADPPIIGGEYADNVHGDSARVHVDIDPNGGSTSYHLEWGTDEIIFPNSAPIPAGQLLSNAATENVTMTAGGLAPGTTYYYRVVAVNAAGPTIGAPHTVRTFPYAAVLDDPCPNAHVRQQTGAALLPDCRAYELVSAEDTGGYNVESSLVAGQSPYGGYPDAAGRALYAIHDGGIPGSGKPTNRGPDPYVAVRDEANQRWQTRYVGIPSDAPSTAAFASTLADADGGLDTFAFSGPDICDPCFADGSSGIPLRQADGTLIQGMAGSIPVADPQPAGEVQRPLSHDGSHFVFGSTDQFVSAGNDNGDVTIYDRKLQAGTTQVASTLPDGSTMTGPGIAQLDISNDGSRILIGRLVSTDAKGNQYFDLYMHVGDSPDSVQIADTPSGVLYGGMTADGSRVFFTTPDQLAGDGDTSADLFRADVEGSGAAITRVSVGSGGSGNTDTCDPDGDSVNPANWNTIPSGPTDCSVAAIAGGGGVARDSGAVYFLSPEKLDGASNGASDRPNLYIAEPGSSPRFVATLESSQTGPVPPIRRHVYAGAFGSFTQPTGIAFAPNGDIYVYDIGDSPRRVERYTPSGVFISAINQPAGFGEPNQIAVDQTTGDLYVPNGSQVRRYDNSGALLNTVINRASFPFTAVAVDPANGNVYAAGEYAQVPRVFVLTPNGDSVRDFEVLQYARALAVDSKGRVYLSTVARTDLYSPTGQLIRTVANGSAYGLVVDPGDDSVYIDQGNRILHLDASGKPIGPVEGGNLSTGRGIALEGAGNRFYAVQSGEHGEVRYFDDAGLWSDPRTDNPAVIHGVNDSGTRHTEDLQVTPDGRIGAFPSTRPLTGYDNNSLSEVFRYDADSESLACASCSPTGARAAGDAALPPSGLGIIRDGRVFFNSTDALAPRDLNGKLDAYVWDQGTIDLISTGSSAFDSSLLGVSSDGTDAYFFTRDRLVPQDANGSLVKLYDARVGGGFLFVAPPPSCKASDECHGPGSEAAAPAPIATVAGTGGNQVSKAKKCRRPRVRRGGRCAKPKKPHERRRDAQRHPTHRHG